MVSQLLDAFAPLRLVLLRLVQLPLYVLTSR